MLEEVGRDVKRRCVCCLIQEEEEAAGAAGSDGNASDVHIAYSSLSNGRKSAWS